MGVDTEKEMDIVTRKVDRVFQVVRMMFLNGDKSWLLSSRLLLTRKVWLRLFPIWWSWVQTYMWRYQDIGPSCFITLLCSSLRHDEYHDFRKMASKTTFHLQRLDLDEDGEVTVEEFLQACTQDKTIRWGHINGKWRWWQWLWSTRQLLVTWHFCICVFVCLCICISPRQSLAAWHLPTEKETCLSCQKPQRWLNANTTVAK